MEVYDKAKIAEIKALRRERSTAAAQKELSEKFSASSDADVPHSAEADHELREEDAHGRTNFNLREEEELGHYDKDGYFIYNDNSHKAEGVRKDFIHASKSSRENMKRKLGIDDIDSFIEDNNAPNKMMRSRYKKDEKEYSDGDDDEEQPETWRDPWIDGLETDERARFKNAEQHERLMNAKAQEKKKVEERLENRFGSRMTFEEKLRTLIALMQKYGAQTAAHLIVRIKEKGVREVEDESMLTEKEKLVKKKTFQKSVKLKPETLKQMNDVTELCDELTLNGYQIYDESVAALENLLETR